jgi:dihydrofolate synthase/folylpolyglutamate synthase
MNYQQAIAYILKFADYERLPRSGVVWDLARIERLLKMLGNPQDAAKSVHVAGTKGKGSTAAMISSILSKAGYRVGLYTSPHLLSFTERIRADGQPIAEADWAWLTEVMQPEIEAINEQGELGELTTFEILTALAFVYFREIKADYQVLEVGLGGRLDATNVIKPPDVAVITSISFDHMEVLGDTLVKIAAEKAGIVKAGSAVVCSPQDPEAMEVIEGVCRRHKVRLVRVGEEVTWQKGDFNEGAQSFHLKGLLGEYDLTLPLLGEHQLENAATAVAVVETLIGRGAKVAPENISAGLAKLSWVGRLQVLRRQPYVVIDGAHNADSVRRLGEALRQYFKYERLILVLGVSADKDVAGIVAAAAIITGDIVIGRSRHPRAIAPEKLAVEFSLWKIAPRTAETVAEAMRLALEMAGPDDLICAAGSVFVIAEVLEGFK